EMTSIDPVRSRRKLTIVGCAVGCSIRSSFTAWGRTTGAANGIDQSFLPYVNRRAAGSTEATLRRCPVEALALVENGHRFAAVQHEALATKQRCRGTDYAGSRRGLTRRITHSHQSAINYKFFGPFIRLPVLSCHAADRHRIEAAGVRQRQMDCPTQGGTPPSRAQWTPQ